MSSLRAPAWLLMFFGLCAVGLALYGPMLGEYFIADDFINFGFVRHYRGSWSSFFDPRATFSDPVTQSRYKPLYTLYVAAIDRAFGDHVLAHHLCSIALHALVGVAVAALASALYASRTLAWSSAILFVSSRLHSQTVMWISASYRLLSTALALACIVASFGDASAARLLLQAALFTTALWMNPDLIAVLPALALLALYHRNDRPRRFLHPLAVCTLVGLAFSYANMLSTRAFPDSVETQLPDLVRALHLLTLLFVPFEVPFALKVALTALVVLWVFAGVGRDERRLLLLACALPSIALWSMLSEYVLAPRYLYFSGAFTAILLARLLLDACSRLASLARDERVCAVLSSLLVGAFVVLQASALRRHDLVLYDYRARLGERLADVRAAALRAHERVPVYVRPHNHLPKRDRTFFEDALVFVDAPGPKTRIVDTDFARYVGTLGAQVESEYWYLPWFR